MNNKSNTVSSKAWCITFILTIILIATFYAGFNILVDPFGVFGDKFLNWYSYNITNNPRVAKIAYLEKDNNYKNYDSYIIGCSSTSSFPKEALDEYIGGSWYNMIMYGADMLDVEQTTEYVIENFNAKNIMINVFISNATKYNEEEDRITKNMHAKVNGENLIDFYSRYAFVNPEYSLAKLNALKDDSYLTKPFDVFNIETGAYDKKVRDSESIGDLDEYLEKDEYKIFANYPTQEIKMTKIDETIASIKRIKEFCDNHGVKVYFVMAPVYTDYLKYFYKDDVIDYYTKVANVTEYWDFTTSSLTYEPRFFYDETHFRNDFGKMCIAKISNSKATYYPDDIGELVNKDNVLIHMNKVFANNEKKMSYLANEYSRNVPILTFHSIVDNPKENTEASPKKLEETLKYLEDNNYTTILFEDLYKYIYEGAILPQKPVLITFDDGYLNNYELAFPILKEHNAKATIFMIGVVNGSKGFYKDTNNKMKKHFSFEQAKEMLDSGLVDIQSHTFDMHQWKPFELDRGVEENKIRENILKFDSEKEDEYIKVLTDDVNTMNKLFNDNLNYSVSALSYPSGKHDKLSEVVLSQNKIKATVTIEEGTNVIIKGLPQSLYTLKRNNIEEGTNLNILFEYLSK